MFPYDKLTNEQKTAMALAAMTNAYEVLWRAFDRLLKSGMVAGEGNMDIARLALTKGVACRDLADEILTGERRTF